MENNLIVVKQLPVIEQQLRLVSEEIDKKVNDATSLICTEDNYKTIKEVRAALNKEAKEWETKRKEVKEEVMKPYEEFEKIYKENIGDKYKNADIELKTRIESVENELKQKKNQEICKYFEEYRKSKNIDFVSFSQAGINVTLSASIKNLKEQVESFINKIQDDLNLIEVQEHKAEILVEYKQNLNVSQAITIVANRFKAVEEEQEKMKREEQAKEEAQNLAKDIVNLGYVPANEMAENLGIGNDFKIIHNVKVACKLDDKQFEQFKRFLDLSDFEYELEEE